MSLTKLLGIKLRSFDKVHFTQIQYNVIQFNIKSLYVYFYRIHINILTKIV